METSHGRHTHLAGAVRSRLNPLAIDAFRVAIDSAAALEISRVHDTEVPIIELGVAPGQNQTSWRSSAIANLSGTGSLPTTQR
jgi:hypothetical protein